jgi:hypothetical protein
MSLVSTGRTVIVVGGATAGFISMLKIVPLLIPDSLLAAARKKKVPAERPVRVAVTGKRVVPEPIGCGAVLSNVESTESVPYSNQYWVWRPFGRTVPFRTALFSDRLVAASDVTAGGDPELLVPPIPPPPPAQVARKMQIVGRNIRANA